MLHTLPNGVRVIVLPRSHLRSASASVFVRTGSAHERPRHNGISHVAEHMAFKGTAERDAYRINLDAELLGAEVNAHTDKDHTAYHMSGLAEHAGDFVRMLADIVLRPVFPPDELERERGVILQELLEDQDDPVSTANKLFDRACFGTHASAQPVIGTRAGIARLAREDLLDHVRSHHTGANLIVGVAGGVDADAILAEAERAFATVPAGTTAPFDVPAYVGGAKVRRMAGSSQSHVVLGHALPGLDDPAHGIGVVAAAVLGEGMSSPLLHELREREGLAYHLSCTADLWTHCGQFVVEASTTPEQLDKLFAGVRRLLAGQAARVTAEDLQRARRQIEVRDLRNDERPARALEDAALELYATGRVRSAEERRALTADVSAAQVRDAFEAMLKAPLAAALVGLPGRWLRPRLEEWVAPV